MRAPSSMTHQESATHEYGVLEEAVPWHAIEHQAVVNEEDLFYLITIASFIKSASGLYIHSMVKYLSADGEIANWLEHHWLEEELQHGRALARYVLTVWPQFDWDSVYEYFFKEFATTFRDGALAPSRSLEMVACCVLEMANAGYYAALSGMTQEPILSLLARRISEDEVRQYQNFYRYFSLYRQVENTSRVQVLRTMWQRLKLLDGGDSVIAMKHVYGACHPDEPSKLRTYRQMQKRCRHRMARYFPRKMGAEMVLKPLDLGLRFQHMTVSILGRMAQRFVT